MRQKYPMWGIPLDIAEAIGLVRRAFTLSKGTA